ncbi:acyl carrier protein [Serratia proteamaculans]|jgi:acyl carrier protein|uniref:acyl carrier protein n=1 Tax=Serratia proteamaculans TaxID=28151 RepID=UPI0015A1F440|nr:acyl carrier protein [Serratia proteamaculans]NWA74237.1 acyl carrier protein [Serratia proteamaculans]
MEKYRILYEKVCALLYEARELEPASLSADISLRQLGLDSLDYVELMLLARREFGITLNAELFLEQPDMTLGELCRYMNLQ